MNFFIKSISSDKYLNKNVFTFVFNYKANKLNIKKEIEKRYNVTIKIVRTMILLLKKGSKYKKIKKVLIKLKKNQYIEV